MEHLYLKRVSLYDTKTKSKSANVVTLQMQDASDLFAKITRMSLFSLKYVFAFHKYVTS